MNDNKENPLELSYATVPRAFHERRIARLMGWLPHWAVAVALLLPFWALSFLDVSSRGSDSSFSLARMILWYLCGFAIIIAGAVKRLNLRHFFIMLVVAISPLAMHTAVAYLERSISKSILFFYFGLAACYAIILMTGIAEWVLVRRQLPDASRALGRVFIYSLGAACIVHLAYQFLQFSNPASYTNIGMLKFGLGVTLKWFMLALAMWAVIPLALRKESLSRRQRWIAGSAIAAAAALWALFFHFGVFSLAQASVAGRGLFNERIGMYVLNIRGSASDVEAVWKAVEKCDWNTNRELFGDIREDYIAYFEKHDPNAGARLSAMIQRQPRRMLVATAAPLLARDRRYEMAPFLLRYSFAMFEPRCTKALESMGIAYAALPILLHPPEFDERGDARLSSLLGVAGRWRPAEWYQYVTIEKIDERPTPLSPEQQDEMRRVVDVVWQYRKAAETIRGRTMYWDARDTAALEWELQKFTMP